MEVIADLEVHSKYARAVSSSMNIPTIAEWANKKGIALVGTGDFTHPMWFREIQSDLKEAGEGIYKLKTQKLQESKTPKFLLTSEISCIYMHNGKGRRVHILIYLPGFSDVGKFNQKLTSMGANLFSDGRPIVGLTLAQIAETALEINTKALIIPAHVWTPWFGFYGSMSGYESLSEAFGGLEKYIPAVETGLSSDPAMNWRIQELINRRVVSFGDAHSPQKLGREATVFEVESLSYDSISRAIWGNGPDKISYTIEFYPEEGKYHYTGHRNCNISYSPNEARKKGMICPVCGKRLTKGVMSRVEELASQEIAISKLKITKDEYDVQWIGDEEGLRSPYVMLVPLFEIISQCLERGEKSQKVVGMYEQLTEKFDGEFNVLLKVPAEEIMSIAGKKVAEAISKVRSGDVFIKPGYDGVFGTVKISQDLQENMTDDKNILQTSLF